MALIPGTRLGPYAITASIGAGGAGAHSTARTCPDLLVAVLAHDVDLAA